MPEERLMSLTCSGSKFGVSSPRTFNNISMCWTENLQLLQSCM
jgi:hypothetical protein